MVRLPSKTLRQRGHRGATESCQDPTHAVQQATPSIDYLIVPQEELLGGA